MYFFILYIYRHKNLFKKLTFPPQIKYEVSSDKRAPREWLTSTATPGQCGAHLQFSLQGRSLQLDPQKASLRLSGLNSLSISGLDYLSEDKLLTYKIKLKL